MSDGIQIHDFWDFSNKEKIFRLGSLYKGVREVLHDSHEDLRSGNALLEVKGPASFSGQIINGRVYPGLRIKDSLHTWTIKGSERPVLVHHKSGGGLFGDACDPIGRIKHAQFIPYVDESKLENDFLRPSKKGSGELFLTYRIMDQDAIQKVIDGRYKTVSVGFKTDSLTCSICNSDWIADEICEHRPLHLYQRDGKGKERLAYLVTGNKDYRELSFVNIPAARRATATSHKLVTDALEDSFSNLDDVCAPLLDSRSIDLQLNQFVAGNTIYDIINAEDREVISVNTTSVDSEQEEITLTDEEFAEAHILKELLSEDSLEFDDEFTKDSVEELVAKLEDAKLSTKQRKALSSSTFCGPKGSRAFPIPDCSHYSAGLRLLGRYKGPGSKSTIRACIMRKGKKMGCAGATKDSEDSLTPSEDSTCECEGVLSTDTLANQGTKTPDNEAAMSDSTEHEAKIAELEAEIAELKKGAEAYDSKIEALVEENKALSGQVQDHLAETLLDLRIRTKHPSTTNLSDEEKRAEVLTSLKARSRVSLEDAIADERLREQHQVIEDSKPQERGTVTQEDVGVVTNNTKDEPVKKVDKQERKVSPLSYRDKARQALTS